MHPYNPPDIITYFVLTAFCVAAMFAVSRLIPQPFATHVSCLLALLPAVVCVWSKQCFLHLIATAGYTGITPLEVIYYRHQISLQSGIASSGILLIVATGRAAFITYWRPAFTTLLSMLVLLILSGCSHLRHGYSPTDEFFASGRFPVPSEFRRGTASRSAVDAWSCSLLGTNPLESCHIDIDGDRVGELFVSQPAHRGTGGNSYLIFREGRRGFHYLGTLFFGLLRPMAADSHGRVRVLTSSSSGGGECMVIIQVLRSDGFHSAASRILPCGDSATDGEGGRLVRLLFDSESLPQDVLQVVFGANL